MNWKIIVIVSALLLNTMTLTAQSHRVTSAWNHLQHNEIPEAYEAIEKALEHPRTKDDAQTWYYRGVILIEIAGSQEHQDIHENAFMESYESFKKALELDRRGRYENEVFQYLEQMALQFFNTGVELYNENRFADALNYFETYMEAVELMDPDHEDLDAKFYSGYAAFMDDQHDLALDYLTQLDEAGYDDANVYLLKAEILLERADTTQALETLAKGRERFSSNTDIVMTELQIYMEKGETDELITRLEEAVEMEPDNTDLRLVLATAYDEMGEYNKARPHYETALEQTPDNFNANYNYGAMLFNQGAQIANEALDIEDEEERKEKEDKYRDIFREALPFLEKAHNMDDEHRHTLISLRQIYLRLGKREEAQQIENKLDQVEGGGSREHDMDGEIEQTDD